MSLTRATVAGAAPPALPASAGPFAATELHAWAGVDFDLPPGDPRLARVHDGAPAPEPAWDNLVGAREAWRADPAVMDFLDPDSPAWADKDLERSIYLDRWDRWVPAGSAVLDLGGNIGRFATWALDRGCDVYLVDPDLRALRRAVAHAVGRPGRLDVYWTTGEALPDLPPIDVVLAAEVLCYTAEPERVLDGLRRALVPGGPVLLSVEARWGWAMARDAPHDQLGALLDDGLVHVPGDRWVRTYDEARLRTLLRDWDLVELVPTHYASSGPFEHVAGDYTADELLEWEARLRAHPVTRGLNRCWTAVARSR